jgi:hypothetical protein
MDCLRSFQLNIFKSAQYSTPQFATWGSASNYHWVLNYQNDSEYLIEGFKNINCFGVEMIGYVQANNQAPTTKAVVLDYGFNIILNGQMPVVSGQINPTPDFWGLRPTAQRHALSKYLTKITFETPVQSLKSVTINRLFAQGQNAESATLIDINLDMTFNFFYKYEGE